MKKFQWMTLLGLMTCVLAFVACGDDDDDDDGGSTGLKGTWTYAYTLTDAESQTRHGVDVTLTFTDNTYELRVIQNHSHQLQGDFQESFGEGERGTYTYTGTTLRLAPNAMCYYEHINENKLGWSQWETMAADAYQVNATVSGRNLTITNHTDTWYWSSWGDGSDKLTLNRK